MMKFLLVFAVIVGTSVCGLAQQNNNLYKLKHPAPQKQTKSAPITVPPNTGAASARNLQNIERESGKPATTAAKPTAKASAVKIKPVQDKPTPPINFAGSGGAKKPGVITQSSNPLQGRLKQKQGQ
jgi:uncharacterized protein HemX